MLSEISQGKTLANPSGLPQSTIPGPPPIPFLGWRGNLIRFIRDPIAYMRGLHKAYGEIASLVKGEKSMIFAFGQKYNQQILSNASLFLNAGIVHRGPKNSANYRVSLGLLSMNGAQHKRHRNLLMPPFHHKVIPTYYDSIVSLTETMLNRWTVHPSRDIWYEMKQLTKLISSKLLFGFDDPSQAYAVADVLENWQNTNISPGARLLPYEFPGTPYFRMLRLAEKLEAKIKAMIEERRAHPSELRGDILSILIHARHEDGSSLSDEELIGQTNFLFDASYETTSNSLSWTFFLLSQHPKIMSDLYDELEKTLGGNPPSMDQMNQLPVLDRVIKESMRLLAPPVYSYRVTSEATEIGPYAIRKGSTVAFSHYITHHLSELFPEPEKFLPERWRTLNPSPYAYLPFGAGAHMCLGMSFAMMTMRIVLAMTLQRYRLTVVPKARIDRKVLVTLAPKYGIPVRIQKQDREFAKSKTKVRGNIHEMVDLE